MCQFRLAHVVWWTIAMSRWRSLFTADTQEYAWARRGTRGLLRRKDTLRSSLARAERASTRLETQHQEAPPPITRGVQNLQLTDTPAAQPTRTATAPPPMPSSRRPTQQRSRHQRDYLRCAQCGSDPEACVGGSDSWDICATSTEASLCFKKVLLSSDSIGQPVCSVAPPGGGATAETARRTLRPGISE